MSVPGFVKLRRVPCEEVGVMIPEDNMTIGDYRKIGDILGGGWCLDVKTELDELRIYVGKYTRENIPVKEPVYGVILRNNVGIARVKFKNIDIARAFAKALQESRVYSFKNIRTQSYGERGTRLVKNFGEDYRLVCDSQDVVDILWMIGRENELSEWPCLFVKVENGDILEVWGIHRSVPYLNEVAYLLYKKR